MGKKITIYDLAEQLEVSPATVSRSLNNHPSISLKTKTKVLTAARNAGYKVNKFAVNLSKQKSNTIGVIVPKLDSAFMSTMLAGVEKVANEAGYNLIISQSLESMEKEKMNAQALFQSGVDALIVSLAYDTSSYEHFTNYISAGVPVLFVDRVFSLDDCATIVIDNRKAGYDATKHLIAQGCRNLLHISGHLNRSVYADRLSGFKTALAESGIKYSKANVWESDLDPKNVNELVDFLKQTDVSFDGIFVSNDRFAASCIKELQKAGFDIPKDIKVIGFNNDPICELITPSLSTIDYPGYQMGVLAAQGAINHLNGNIDLHPTNAISLRHQLIIRESTANSFN
ncbi:LacI family DNA-binding transcriptional regulator [Flagellimonas myxillae]|uniref:LacI family DNA-binding transcriptional regulator n=1 Tax=Flagellimonas myxillae TaxID=2942214 RepID=UPI00201F59A9|nr:LacI family DNA-binding transcriptional regulator [Muricauda myxillae]MCL6265035.1 LacI family transcriptional regulator [Muricauda myxillae]